MAHLCCAYLCDFRCSTVHLDRQNSLTACIQREDRRTIRAGFYPALHFLLPDRVICHARYRRNSAEALTVTSDDAQDPVEMWFLHIGKFSGTISVEICRADRGKPAKRRADVSSDRTTFKLRLAPLHDDIPDCEARAFALIALDDDDFISAVAIQIGKSWCEIFEDQIFR